MVTTSSNFNITPPCCPFCGSPSAIEGTVRLNRLARQGVGISVWAIPKSLSFRYFKTSSGIIQLAVMLYVRFLYD